MHVHVHVHVHVCLHLARARRLLRVREHLEALAELRRLYGWVYGGRTGGAQGY